MDDLFDYNNQDEVQPNDNIRNNNKSKNIILIGKKKKIKNIKVYRITIHELSFKNILEK